MGSKHWRLQSREDFEELLRAILAPLIPHYSQGGARLKLGATAAVYDQGAVWAEAFLRPLWGLAPFWAGGGSWPVMEDIYRKGLASGTDPMGEEYWGGFSDGDQRFVEMAALAWALVTARDVLWEPLGEEEKNAVCAWLDGINHYSCPPCNWMFFVILVNAALKKLGRPWNREKTAESLDYIESCYERDGWYVDGQNGERDYYVSFAFHYYGLIYASWMGEEDPARRDCFLERAAVFAREFAGWFAQDGSALAYGRSLTYRMAQTTFFSMCVSCGQEVLPYPVMKGIIARNLRFWMDRPIFDSGGVLTIGYGYPNLLMAEQYNAPGSPYWCMKAFALLTLPAGHAFWQMEEAPLLPLAPLCLTAGGYMLLQRIRGNVFAYTAGRFLPHSHVHMEEKYSKFVYSSRFAFSVPRSLRTLEEAAPDNVLAFVHGGMVYTKGVVQSGRIEGNHVHMEWSPFPGVDVRTEILVTEQGHRRRHQICSAVDCMAWDCGFALPDRGQEMEILSAEGGGRMTAEDGEALIFRCAQGDGHPEVIKASPNTNLLEPRTRIPAVRFAVRRGMQEICTEFLWEEEECAIL